VELGLFLEDVAACIAGYDIEHVDDVKDKEGA
jgi:hypothetical protein